MRLPSLVIWIVIAVLFLAGFVMRDTRLELEDTQRQLSHFQGVGMEIVECREDLRELEDWSSGRAGSLSWCVYDGGIDGEERCVKYEKPLCKMPPFVGEDVHDIMQALHGCPELTAALKDAGP